MRKIIYILLISSLLAMTAVSQNHSKKQNMIAKLVAKELKKKNVNSVFLNIFSPTLGIDWQFAEGKFFNGESVSLNNPFYTASIGKTFTAVSIAMLSEKQKLNFDDKITKYLPDSIMKGLHMLEGNDYSDEITIAHLLQHTSGLPDYFEGKTIDNSPNGMELLFEDTDKTWTPAEMVSIAKDNMKPLFKPGTGYMYTDTEYVLLGMIIEKISGQKLSDFFMENIFAPFKLNHTYIHLRSDPITKTAPIAEFYAGEYELTKMKSLTLDWAGGGIVSTASDLNSFLQSLMNGEIVADSTLRIMQQWVPETKGMYYGFGLRKIVFNELFPTLPKINVIGHSGAIGSFMYYSPDLDVYVSGTLNQIEEVKQSVVLMMKLLSVFSK